MQKRVGILLAITIFITLLYVLSLSAEIDPTIKWSIENNNILDAFWMENSEIIGILEGRKITAVDLDQNVLWNKEFIQPWFYTTLLKKMIIYSPDEKLQLYSPLDGSVISEINFDGKQVRFNKGFDGIIGIGEKKSSIVQLRVFDPSGKVLWQTTTDSLDLSYVLPGGRVLVGKTINHESKEIEIHLITQENRYKIQTINDPYLYSGETSLTGVTNKRSKNTILAVWSTPWWAIISETGEIINTGKNIFIDKADHIESFGSGFAIASTVGRKLAVISGNGSLLWTKEYAQHIESISGNANFLAVNLPGKILIYNKSGELKGTLEVPTSLRNIKIADNSNRIIGVSIYNRIQLIEF
ncbi:MAG TPA: hypothetical protein DC024_09360 [Clostridiales bacterium]|nr:hypothetical protein [Clostridiales bacterium]